MPAPRSLPPLPRTCVAAVLVAAVAACPASAQDATPAPAAPPAAAPDTSAPAADSGNTTSFDTTVCLQMANAHDPQTLYPELWTLPDQRPILFLGFGSPEGRDFLLQKIADPAEPRDHRLVLVAALRAAGPVYQSKYTNITPTGWGIKGRPDAKNSGYLTRIAQLALANAQDEELDLALLDALAWQALGSPTSRDPELQIDWDSAADVLAQLYAQTKSDPVRYAAEQLALQIGGDALARLKSPSGPVLSLINQAAPNTAANQPGAITNGPAVPSRVIDLVVSYEYQTLPGAEKITKAAVVLEPVHPGPEYVFTQRVLPFAPERPTGSGSFHLVLPLAIQRTQYRVFFRFLAGDQVVSEGHGVTVQL